METDWSIFFICQVKNTDKVRSTDDGYINLAESINSDLQRGLSWTDVYDT